MSLSLPEVFKIVEAMPNATDAAGRTGDYVSLKNAKRAYIFVDVAQGNSATIAITVEQASAVAGTGSKAITNTVPIWSNLDTAASDTLVRRTDAVAYTTDAGVKNKQVKTGASNVANLTSATYFLESRYPQATPPAAITD